MTPVTEYATSCRWFAKAAIPMPPPGKGWRLLHAVSGDVPFLGSRAIVVWYWQKDGIMHRQWASTRKEIFNRGVIGNQYIVNAPVAPPGEGWTLRAAITYQNIVIWYWERDIEEYDSELAEMVIGE